jgi:hypothetical protein
MSRDEDEIHLAKGPKTAADDHDKPDVEECDHPSHHDHPEPQPSWVKQMLGSYVAGVLGVAFFVGSFVLLYHNEGRIDEAALLRGAVGIDAMQPMRDAHGKLVAASGPLTGSAPLGDAYVLPERYLSLSRKVETYAWIEEPRLKPGTIQKITAYRREWTTTPPDSRAFKVQAGHTNPQPSLKSESWTSSTIKLGVLALDADALTLPSAEPIAMTPQNSRGGVAAGGFLYLNGAKPAAPRVGDVRLSYSGQRPLTRTTVLGKLEEERLVPYPVGDEVIYRLGSGSRGEEANRLSRNQAMLTWLLRLIGFALMWAGLRLLMEPFNTLFDRVPVLNSLGRGMTGAVTFPIALVLSVVTMGVAWVTHSLVAMAVVGGITLVACVAAVAAMRGKPAAV